MKTDFDKLTTEFDNVLNVPVISGCIRLCRNVRTCIDVYSDTERKYEFSDKYDIEKLMAFLQKEANLTADSALCLGFLYDHGIGVE